ncbi:MAG: hypothetical protein GY862_21875, partial [Gammaproteobacteria bacterium]|nr:hypothetical protein [Gammaproteobacteria bacterium]
MHPVIPANAGIQETLPIRPVMSGSHAAHGNQPNGFSWFRRSARNPAFGAPRCLASGSPGKMMLPATGAQILKKLGAQGLLQELEQAS